MRTSRRTLLNHVGNRRSPSLLDAEGHAGALVVVVDDIAGIEARFGPADLAEVLRICGHRIRMSLRAEDFTARWGGEELVVILRAVSIDGAVEIGQRIRMAISQPITLYDGRSLVPTCSIGAATGDPDRVEELIERAQRNLALAKASGGNCVRRALPAADRWTAGAFPGL